jgi:hypothetical protein
MLEGVQGKSVDDDHDGCDSISTAKPTRRAEHGLCKGIAIADAWRFVLSIHCSYL